LLFVCGKSIQNQREISEEKPKVLVFVLVKSVNLLKHKELLKLKVLFFPNVKVPYYRIFLKMNVKIHKKRGLFSPLFLMKCE